MRLALLCIILVALGAIGLVFAPMTGLLEPIEISYKEAHDHWIVSISIPSYWWNSQAALWSYFAASSLILFSMVRLRYHQNKVRLNKLEEMVTERTTELESANLAKSRFVSALSHEIRNPLNGIVGGIRRLDPNKPVSRELISSLHRPTVYLARLLNNALDFARYEAGKATIRPTRFRLTELLQVALDVYGDTARRHKIAIATDGPDTAIIADRHALETVLLNLVSNAVRFTPKGGIILIATDLQTHDETTHLVLRVRDSGLGIPRAELDKIFAAFSQSSVAPAVHGERGSGVGLSLIAQILKLLNGTITVESETSAGSLFTATIPVQLPKQDDITPTPQGRTSDMHIRSLSGTYLVVDDLDYNAQSLAAMLSDLGATSETCSTGLRSTSLADQTRYDAIFMDIDLPDISGIEAAQMIRRRHPATKMIALTAYASAAVIDAEREGIFDGILEKPLAVDAFRSLLESLLPSKIETTTGSESSDLFSQHWYDLGKLNWLANLEKKSLAKVCNEYVSDLQRLSNEPVTREGIHQLKGHLGFIQDTDGCALAKQWLVLHDQGESDMRSLTHELQQHCDCVARETQAYSILGLWKSSGFTNPFANA